MANAEYQIVFRGEVTGELPEHAVKQNLAAMFKMPESRVEGLFSGKPVVVKKGVDEATAHKFQTAFRKAGAVCELQDVSGEASAPSATASSSQPAGTSAAQAGGEHATSADATAGAGGGPTDSGAGQAATAPSQGSGAAGSIAAAGDPNQTIVSKTVPDGVGDLDVSAPGEPLVTEERDKTPPSIDTSDLTITDEPLGDGRRTTGDDPGIDTSDLGIVKPE